MAQQPDIQAPSLNRRKVGDYVVTYLSDGYLDGSFGYLQGITADDAAAMLTAAFRLVVGYIQPQHRDAARRTLARGDAAGPADRAA